MTIRTNLSTLSLLGVLNDPPATSVHIQQYIQSVLDPEVQVTAANCNTQLGLQVLASEAFPYLGQVLLDGTVITSAYLQSVPPTSTLNIRTLSTCTAPSGICQACLATAGLSANVGDYLRIPTTSANRYTYVLTLIDSYWGSLFTAQPLNIPYQLPVRRALYYSNLQTNLQNTFATRLNFNQQTEDAVLGIQDPFEQFLVIAVSYCLGGQP